MVSCQNRQRVGISESRADSEIDRSHDAVACDSDVSRRATRALPIVVMFVRMSDEPVAPQKLQVQLDDDVAQGVYSNLVLLNHTENEFVLDFAFIQPANGRAKVRTRVISSPRHTKRLLLALQKNVERYEERFGRIDLGPDEELLH